MTPSRGAAHHLGVSSGQLTARCDQDRIHLGNVGQGRSLVDARSFVRMHQNFAGEKSITLRIPIELFLRLSRSSGMASRCGASISAVTFIAVVIVVSAQAEDARKLKVHRKPQLDTGTMGALMKIPAFGPIGDERIFQGVEKGV